MIYWACGALVVALLMFAPILGYLSSPLAPFWLKGSNAIPPAVIVEPAAGPPDPRELDDLPRAGHVTDAQRYQLARTAGFNATDAITMTAISIAEDGSGDPAALSALNKNGTRDLGLWQINTIWWVQFGGASALVDPWRNAQAAYYIKGRQSLCAWSTYEESCGSGHNGSYRAFLARARAASEVQSPAGQA